MSRHKVVSLLGFALLFLIAAPAFPSSSITAGLRSGEALVLEREDRGALALTAADNPVIRFVEVEGAEVVVRLTPIDRTGLDLGSGRVIVVGASEERDVRLREEFTREALDGVKLRLEALQGGGSLLVYTPAENGSGSRLQQSATPLMRHRAVAPPMPAPTSLALIDNAETSGALDSETALLYRVYALFSDARLPVQYRGDDSKIEDSFYMAEVRDRFATLSPATQAALLPFLTPPAYQGSWANAAAGSSLTILDTPPPCQFFSDKWGWVDTSNNLVRVWYRLDVPDDALSAGALAKTIDATIWPKLSGLMTGHLPIPDLNESCNGGNGRLDIYLVDAARSFTIPYTGCSHAPAFILLARTDGNALAAHEIFHAFEFSFPLGGCIFDEKYHWWAEASAQWAQDFVFPSDQREQRAAPSLLDVPEQPLDTNSDRHWYGAYLLPFYVYHRTGSADFVRVSWENCASQPALEALDQALPGGFAAVWPEFVRYNWNRNPVEDYKTWDGLTANARPAGGSSVVVSVAPDFGRNLALGLPRLSATYKDFLFDDSAHTVVFWNGVTTNLVLRDRPLGGLQYENDPASSEQTKGAHVTALIKIGGQWKTENWTDLPYRTYCRDMITERLQELVLIISNSDFKTRERKLEAPGLQPVLFATNMGCWQWKGTVHYDDGPGGLTIDTTVTWTRAETSQTTPSISYEAQGTIVWKLANEACAGGGTMPIAYFSTLTSYNFITSAGTFHRSYVGTGAENGVVSITCGSATIPFAITAWMLAPPQPFMPGIPGARLVLVNSAGNIMDDSYELLPGLPGKWTWHFESQREP